MRLLFLFLLLAAASRLSAQKDRLLPVRINHQWGFIDTGGNLVRPPQYDYIGDINLPWYGRKEEKSGYYLVEQYGLLGLIDSNFSEILAPAWLEIQPINPQIFLVLSSDGYTVVDKSGRDLLGVAYEAVALPGKNITDFFFVQQRGRWGVHRKGGRIVIPTQYAEIAFVNAGNGFFKVKKSQSDPLWLLTDWNNSVVLDKPQAKIVGAGKYFLLTKESINAAWIIRTIEGETTDTLAAVITEVVPVNRHILAYRPGKGDKLVAYVHSQRRVMYGNIDSIWDVDEQLALYIHKKNNGLIDSLGNIIPVENLSDLVAGNGKLYRMRCTDNKWGLYALEKGMVLPCSYDRIDPFVGKLAVCLRDGGYGVLNQTPEEVIPPVFDRIRIEQNTVKCNLGDRLILYGYDPETGIFDAKPDTQNFAIRIKVGFTGLFYGKEDDTNLDEETVVAESSDEKIAAAEEAQDTVPLTDELKSDLPGSDIPAGFQRVWREGGGGFQLYMEIEEKNNNSEATASGNKSGRKSPRKRYRQVGDYTFSKLYKCRDADWTLAVIDGTPANNAFTQNLGIETGVYRMVIYDNLSGKFRDDLEILGVRLRDFRKGSPYAVILLPDGKMGLIGKDGAQATDSTGAPIRFEYIGFLNEDKIRVCVQGQLTRAGAVREKLPALISGKALSDMFNLQYKTDKKRKKPAFNTLKMAGEKDNRKKSTPPRWGFSDAQGNIIIEPVFDFASNFNDSAAICLKNGKWGATGHDGSVIVPFAYDAIKAYEKNWRVYRRGTDTLCFNLSGRLFDSPRNAILSGHSDGLYVFKDKKTGKFGYRDINGKEVIPCRFDAARDFSEGIAVVREAGKWVFIDTSGRVSATPDLSAGAIAQTGDFHEGLCWFKLDAAKTVGYFNRSGAVQIAPAFHGKGGDFRDGLARVKVRRETALIDVNGRFVVEPGRYGVIGDFNRAGLAEVRDTAGGRLRGMINFQGEEIFPLKYSEIISSGTGYAVFDGAYWQYLGHNGKPLSSLKWKERIQKISENLMLVRDSVAGLWQYLVPPVGQLFAGGFRKAAPFQNGFAEVVLDSYKADSLLIMNRFGGLIAPVYGERFLNLSEGLVQVQKMAPAKDEPPFYYINTTGQNPFHRAFFKNEPFNNGIAVIKPKTRAGAINTRGWFVLPPKYASIVHKGNYLQTSPLLQGFVSRDGKQVIEPAFDLVELLDNGLLRVEWGDRIGYLRPDGTWVWPKEGLGE